MAEQMYLVGTFCHENSKGKRVYSAYTMWYAPDWNGCIQYEVMAASGAEAKKRAIRLRREHEERAAHD